MLSLRPQSGEKLLNIVYRILNIESRGDHNILGIQQTIIESVIKLE